MKKITVLVTGTTGFVGSHVLEALLGHDNLYVIAACRDKEKLSRIVPDFKGEVRLGDLTDQTYIRELVKDVDVICHAAAWTSLWAHRKEGQRYYREPGKALIDAAIQSGIQRFIFGWLMEKINPLLPGDPLLTRAIVYLGEDWYAPSDYAKERLGYEASIDWKTAIRGQLHDMKINGYAKKPLVDRI